jgi:hypothetical protein
MGKKNEKAAIEIAVNASGAKGRLSEGALTQFGKAADWLFPQKAARVKITAALTESVIEKIRRGKPLRQAEQDLFSLVFKKEAHALANRQAAADRLLEVLPEVEAQTKSLPAHEDRGTSKDFIARAESIASDLNDSTLRDLFARVLAGEISRPGGYSMKTLELIRTLDADVARLFDHVRQFVFDGAFIFSGEGWDEFLEKRGVPDTVWPELQEAGLVAIGDAFSSSSSIEIDNSATWTYGARQLRAELRANADKDWFSITRLTRAGRQIASVLPPTQDDSYFFEVGTHLADELQGSVTWRYHEAPGEWQVILPPTL